MKKGRKLIVGLLTLGMLGSVCITGSAGTAEAATKGWNHDSKGWWYSYSDGSYAKNAWVKDGGKWYYFDGSGYMVKGWKKISNKWYYFNKSGVMQTGWKKIDGKWYFFAGGAMATGWKKLDGKWYFFGGGVMSTGWKKISKKWYFFSDEGIMMTGIQTINGKKYVFSSEGIWLEGSSSGTKTLSSAKVGDYVIFGTYEQDNDTTNGKESIRWQVLAKKDGKLLLVSEYGLDTQPYHTTETSVNWETCSLRTWLNKDFYNAAFNSTEKKKIQTTSVVNADNPTHGTKGGKTTKDNVFLLSYDELGKYYALAVDSEGSFNDQLCSKPTEYAEAKGANIISGLSDAYKQYIGNGASWLRTPGYIQSYATYISVAGKAYTRGRSVSDSDVTLCPAIWVTP